MVTVKGQKVKGQGHKITQKKLTQSRALVMVTRESKRLLIVVVAQEKLYSKYANRGREFQKCNCFGPPTHVSRDSAHAQWPRTHSQWYPKGNVITHKSRTDRRRVFKLGGKVSHETRHAR